MMGFIEIYWVLLFSSRFYWVSLVLRLVMMGFIGVYWVLLGFSGFFWVLLGFTGF